MLRDKHEGAEQVSSVKTSNANKRPPPKGGAHLSADLLLMAALVGVSRAAVGVREVNLAFSRARGLKSISKRARTISRSPVGNPCQRLDRHRLACAGRLPERPRHAGGSRRHVLCPVGPVSGIAAVVSLYGLFTDATTITNHLGLLSGFLPVGAVEVIGDQVKLLTAQGQSTLGFTFIGTLALSLWGANAATKAIFDALNIIYKEQEKRSFIQLTLRSLVFTLGGIVLVLIAIGGIVIVPVALKVIGFSDGVNGLFAEPAALATAVLSPSCSPSPVSTALGQAVSIRNGDGSRGAAPLPPASGLAAPCCCRGMWPNFGNYNATYGSLGAIIGFLVWMWLSTIVVLTGAEINAETEHQTARDSTEGRGKPIGARGARMADEVGAARS